MKSLKTKVVICEICGKEVIRSIYAATAKYCNDCQDIGATIRDARNRYDKDISIEEALTKISHRKNQKDVSHDMTTIKCIEKTCIVCGKKYKTNMAAKYRSKYCSVECKNVNRLIRTRAEAKEYVINRDIFGMGIRKAKMVDSIDIKIEQILNNQRIEVNVI